MEVVGNSGAKPPISTGFIPRRLQLELYQNLRRFNVIVCHRRFGKTLFSVNHQVNKMVRNTLPAPRMAYIAPTFGQAKRVSWDYYKQYGLKIPGTEAHEQDLRIDFSHNKGKQMLLSGENPAVIKGIYLDDCILDEFGEMAPEVWTESVRPTLADRRGSATFIGTPKGANHFQKLYSYATTSGDPEWYGVIYKASETGLIEPSELESARRTMSEEEYNQEFECSFTAGMVGAYFGRELEKAETSGRIGKFPYDPMSSVDTYWDLGLDDKTAVWFIQSYRGQHRAVDYYEVSGLSIPDIMADIKKKPYSLGTFVFPHDVEKGELSTGRTQRQMFAAHGAKPSRVVPRCTSKRESINAARVILSQVSFDREKCAQGLKALANYQKKWDSKNNVFSEMPKHNDASNGADAFQQFAMGQRGDSRDRDYEQNRGGQSSSAVSSYDPYRGLRR